MSKTMNRISFSTTSGLCRPLNVAPTITPRVAVQQRYSTSSLDQFKLLQARASIQHYHNNYQTNNQADCRFFSSERRSSMSSLLPNTTSNANLNKTFNDGKVDNCFKKIQRKLSTVLAPTTPVPFHTKTLPKSVRDYIEDKANLVNCSNIHICDGSDAEMSTMIKLMQQQKIIEPLEKYENCWLVRTDPKDVARVESKTLIATRNKYDAIPRAKNTGQLGNWMSIDQIDTELNERFNDCMNGRTMYVIPFSMGPIGSTLSKVGIQLTDSPYVVASMKIMTRVSRQIFDLINLGDDFVRCMHSVGRTSITNRNWPCDPERTLIAHIPERKEIASYGSGYGGNSLLGKKCFALRIGSIMGRDEGWLAEHMLILGITNPQGVKKYIAAAFPSACGKTNLAMMTPSLPGYKIECVGDDIAWMRFDENGQLRAINPEAGFFGVAPGTNERTNPIAMETISKNTIFTNVARTEDGDFYWEGLEHRLANMSSNNKKIISWLSEPWPDKNDPTKKAAHPNSRFCAPASQCPIIDPQWENADGVPISAIIFGGRRPEGVPLVYEAFNWQHGVFIGASMRSESTAAAEHKSKVIMHDPFAMRPFFGYNFGHYLQHWLNFGKQTNLRLPKVFHVNWFRKDHKTGQFLWPGFGENSRILDWICRRVDEQNNEQSAISTPIGYVPKPEQLNLNGLDENINLDELLSVPQEFWFKEQNQILEYFKDNVGDDLPDEIKQECHQLRRRLLQQQQQQ